MITILHGDNESQIHAELVKRLALARKDGSEITRLDAKKIEIAQLETVIGTDALFATTKLIVIDGLFALPKSKRKDGFLHWLSAHDLDVVAIMLVEKKTLTPTQLKSFPGSKVLVFKHPAILFMWLETVGTLPPARVLELFHQVIEREDCELAFIMLTRQIRTLLAFVADGIYDGPPFLRGKIASQAQHFTKVKLLSIHAQLLAIDEVQKTSQHSMSLEQNLDLLLVQM